MRIFASDRLSAIMQRLGMEEGENELFLHGNQSY